MSLWDAAIAAFDFVADNSDSIVQAGTTIAGQVISANANEDAARRVAEATDRRTAAIQAGNADATARYEDIVGRTEPGVNALTQIVAADPYELTPQQKLTQDDVRRQSVTSLNKSGLRGSGRAVLEALRGVESDFRANAIDTNLNRRDTASRQLAGENFNATGNAARIDASTGRTVGDAEVGKAVVTGNADTANAGLRGSAIGDIAGIIASEEKVKGRGSKYGSDDDDDNRQVEVSRA